MATMNDRLSVADIDGMLCVRSESASFAEPVMVANYWPTAVRTHDLLRHCQVDSVAQLACVRTHPGEFFVGVRTGAGFGGGWVSGQHIRLPDGGYTVPVRSESRPAPAPKARKGTTVFWDGCRGAWVKRTRGKTQVIDPMTVPE